MKYRGSANKWISIIHRKFQIFLNNELLEYGINSSEFIYIMHIAKNENINLKNISEHLFLDSAGTTRIIQNLEKKNLVEKVRSTEDKREYTVRLTKDGEELVPKIRKALRAWLDIISDGEDIEKLIEMEVILNRMAMKADNYVRGKYKNDDKNDTLHKKI